MDDQVLRHRRKRCVPSRDENNDEKIEDGKDRLLPLVYDLQVDRIRCSDRPFLPPCVHMDSGALHKGHEEVDSIQEEVLHVDHSRTHAEVPMSAHVEHMAAALDELRCGGGQHDCHRDDQESGRHVALDFLLLLAEKTCRWCLSRSAVGKECHQRKSQVCVLQLLDSVDRLVAGPSRH